MATLNQTTMTRGFKIWQLPRVC